MPGVTVDTRAEGGTALQFSRVLVTGASSQIGRFLLPLFARSGIQVTAVSRSGRGPLVKGPRWIAADLSGWVDWSALAPVDAVIHLARLPLLNAHLAAMAELGVRRVLAFSSTSRDTKAESPNPQERVIAAALAGAEEQVAQTCDRLAIAWTLFRPTMIYGAGLDQNVSFIARWLRRSPWFPLAGGGTGRRQPVHAQDLAQACLDALPAQATYGRIYALSGGEILPYRTMVERIGAAIGRQPRFVTLPTGLLRLLLGIACLWPQARHLTPEMADRMNGDLVFDWSAAKRDFGYCPRGFRLEPADLESGGNVPLGGRA